MKKKILIVEDELLIAEDIKKALTLSQYDVCNIVTTGEEAILKVERLRPDLVIMDIMLAGNMTGIEAAKEIRKKYNTAIVFITAYADEKTLDGAMASEPYGYLVKPVRGKDIRATVKIVFQMIKKENDR